LVERGHALPSIETVPYLLYCTPHDPDTTHVFPLNAVVTCLGRLQSDEADPPGAEILYLDLQTVSVCHAKIVSAETGYELHNWHGHQGIGLYEHELAPGESHPLKHCDVFRIPARKEHVRLQFLESQHRTQVIPFDVDPERGKVYVYGTRVKLTPLEYRLIAYLHRHTERLCLYDDLLAALWGDANPFERKGSLEVLLHDVRAKLRAASDGFTFLETVRGQGVRLVV